MSDHERRAANELLCLTESIVASVEELTDAEILAELRESGEDPESLARETRESLQAAVKAFRQQKLLAARRAYQGRLVGLGARVAALPKSAAGRLRLLQEVLTHQPALHAALTAQFRDLRDLPDDDVTSYLLDLAALGALPEEDPEN